MHPQITATPINPAIAIHKIWNARHSIKGNVCISSNAKQEAVFKNDPTAPISPLVSSIQSSFAEIQSKKAPHNVSAPQTTPILSSTTAQRRVTYFVRRGNKARREALFRSFWTTSKRKHSIFQKYRKYRGAANRTPNWVQGHSASAFAESLNSINSDSIKKQNRINQSRRQSRSVSDEFCDFRQHEFNKSSHETSSGAGESRRTFSLAATPYIALVGRRRGRRTVYKIRTVNRSQGQRQSLISLANTRHAGGAASKPFVERFKKQRAAVLAPSAKDRKSAATSTGSLRDKRDEIHQSAFSTRPAHWRRTE